MPKTDAEFAAQEAANKKKAEADFNKANADALKARRAILKEMNLPDDTMQADGSQRPKATAGVENPHPSPEPPPGTTATTTTTAGTTGTSGPAGGTTGTPV